jgi:4-hydroxybenzoate polyprenyltransferase
MKVQNINSIIHLLRSRVESISKWYWPTDLLTSAILLIRSRAKEIFMWTWCTAVSCLIAGRGFPPLLPTVISIISMFFIATSVYLYNDIVDFEFDKFNDIKKHRPLPSGKVIILHAKKIFYSFSFIGLAISLFLNFYSFCFILIYFILFTIYSYPSIYLKKIFIIKESIITSGMILTSLVGSYSVSNSFSSTAFFASILFSIYTFTGQPALNDTMDIEQDKMFGIKTLATILSWSKKVQLFITGVLIIMILTFLTYAQFGFNIMLPIYVVAGGSIFLRYMFPIMNRFEQTAALRAYKVSYLFILLLQIFAIIGSLDINFSYIFRAIS